MKFSIPTQNDSAFQHVVGKLAKRAEKCGVIFNVEVIGTRIEPKNFAEVTRYTEYHVSHTAIKLGEYSLVGTLDHWTAKPSVIINSVPDMEVPEHYQTDAGNCDHCSTKRDRKLTCVLRNEAGEYITVGRSCVKDFIGYDINFQLKYLEELRTLYANIGGGSDEYGFYGNSNGGEREYSMLVWLTQAFAIYRLEGYHNAKSFDPSTSLKTRLVFEPPQFFGQNAEANRQDHYDWVSSVKPTDADRDMAKKAVAWVAETTDTSNYMHNLRAIVAGGFVSPKLAGYATSLTICYAKAMEKHVERAREAELPVTPCPTGKIVITGTVLSIKSQESNYGTTLKMLVRDDSGFKVWGSVPSKINQDDLKGCRVTFSGTVSVSDNDQYFGFFKRPTKASIIDQAPDVAA